MPDVSGKSSKKRYAAKLQHLIKQGVPREVAVARARGYAGGKTAPVKPDPGVAPELDDGMGLPYKTITDIPDNVKKALPEEAQEIWLKTFNKAFEAGGGDEGKAATAAWAAVKAAGWDKNDEGNWVKLVEAVWGLVKLDDESKPIEIMRVGKWDHPTYGKINISEADIDGFIKSFKDGVRGVDLAVDLEHGDTAHKGSAAGWFRDLVRSGQSLFAKVEWTDLGKDVLQKGIYRYFSPEFRFVYTDPETKKKYTHVLFGGALTNRPFIKHMQPVLLSEDALVDYVGDVASAALEVSLLSEIAAKCGVEEDQVADLIDYIDSAQFVKEELPSGWDKGSLKKFLDSVGSPANVEIIGVHVTDPGAFCARLEDAIRGTTHTSGKQFDEEGAKVDLEKFRTMLKLGEEAGEEEIQHAIAELSEVNEGLATELEEANAKVVKLGKYNDEIKETSTKLSERLDSLEVQLRSAEWKEISAQAMSEGRMSAKQAEKLKDRYMRDPKGTSEIVDMLETIVSFGEKGTSKGSDEVNAVMKFDEKVRKVAEERSLGYAEAAAVVEKEDPGLFAQVQAEREGVR